MIIHCKKFLIVLQLFHQVASFSPTPAFHISSVNLATTIGSSTQAIIDAESPSKETLTENPATVLDQAKDEEIDDPKPGLDENYKFQCDDSVTFWREFQRDGIKSAQENLQDLARVASNFAALGPAGLSYWIRHTGRSAYFATNAVLGNVGYMLHERLVNEKEVTFTSALPFAIGVDSASRLLLEAALSYEQDYEQIRTGAYREPWDMQPNHKQSSPINVVTQTNRFIREAIGTLGRRSRGSEEDKKVLITGDTMKLTGASPTGDKLYYPEYYQNAFHYQTDGWMSKESADVYETSTETLFLGRQDAMQRTSLAPLVKLSQKLKNEKNRRSPMRVLEVACGTGRFMTFVRDNLPLDTEYTATDLSPYYLETARENDNYWRETREKDENRDSRIFPAEIIQAQAEDLPFDDDSFDAVVCVYLFHELPRKVRERAAAEMARVVSPGGTVVFTDSIQRGDRPILDSALQNFENMNEPHYGDYIRDDIPGHFERAGLRPMTKTIRSTTKSLSFTKP